MQNLLVIFPPVALTCCHAHDRNTATLLTTIDFIGIQKVSFGETKAEEKFEAY